ncbi:MAG: hypothetical protein DRI01_08055 [Chloroflexi bacterium]|nr:MAG: hypothetical protein DRI01_08055 [Chloroflexota bacterium]
MRDDFPLSIKELLAKRVAYRCSNQECRKVTSGPQEDPTKVINIGVAAHITAASPGGPRFDPSLTPNERQSVENGIWLCQSCAKLVDSDSRRYGVDTLRQWKALAETIAARELESWSSTVTDADQKFIRLEKLMPDLISEMRKDLNNNPLSREFVILKKSWSYWAKGYELVYYFDEHPDLENKLFILQNYGLIQDITYNNTTRYIITEEFANYLTRE